jgi:hypothetical protein
MTKKTWNWGSVEYFTSHVMSGHLGIISVDELDGDDG